MTSEETPGQGWSNGDIPPQLFPQTQNGRVQLYSSQRRWIGLTESWSRIGKDHTALDAVHSDSHSGATTTTNADEQARAVRSLISQLCEKFYQSGWATGTGGGISIRVKDSLNNWRVFVAPSGIQKEDMIGDDVFELDMDGNIVVPPKTPNLKQSACTPLWYVVYRRRPTARAVIHTHSMYAQMATLLDENSTTLKITHLEMLKGVGNHAYDDILEIPIIDNRPTEDLLAEQLERVIQKYPRCNAVLVRRHGVYVWGDSWEQAKTQCESFDYLFQSAVMMKTQMGVDPGKVPTAGTYRDGEEEEEGDPPRKKPKIENGFHGNQPVDNALDVASNTIPLVPRNAKILVLDIEGCTTSIAFVKDVLFPIFRQYLEEYLGKKYPTDGKEYNDLRVALKREVESTHGYDKTQSENIHSVVELVTYLMDRDVKSATLKSLQGDMWEIGYQQGILRGHVYNDVPLMLQYCQQIGVDVYIYSSGSIAAQKLLFGHSTAGDLLPFLKGHFDIPTAGSKLETSSYQNIAKQLGTHDILFCSDSEAELVAAQQAGLKVAVSIRPGNAPLSEAGKNFPQIHSLLQICGE